jgi:hypothetical protein
MTAQRRNALAVGAIAALALLAIPAAASAAAAAAPVLTVKAEWGDTNLQPGGAGQFLLFARNVGTSDAAGAITIKDTLPQGVVATGFDGKLASNCFGTGSRNATCVLSAADVAKLAQAPGDLDVSSGYLPGIVIDVSVAAAASGTGTNLATISGGGAAPATDTDPVTFSATPAGFGIVPNSFESGVFDGQWPAGNPESQAGAHPFELRVNFDLNEATGFDDAGVWASFTRYTTPHGSIKDAEVTLPRGLIGNPEATPKCDPADFANSGVTLDTTVCPPDTQVGYLNIEFGSGIHNYGYGGLGLGANRQRVAIYNLEPPTGVPADFGFNTFVVTGHIYPSLDPAQHYAIKTLSPVISNFVELRGTQVTFWGVPGDPSHDALRAFSGPSQTSADHSSFTPAYGAPFGAAAIRPLLTLPMDCGFDNGGFLLRVDSWNDPGNYTPTEESANHLGVSGCDDPRIRFNPEVTLQPTDRHAGAPTGLQVDLNVPQRDDAVADANILYQQNGDVQALPIPPLKEAVVKMPVGMTISPSAAQGLGSCSPAQLGLGTNDPVTCPDNSQYGTLTLHTSILPKDAPMHGQIYIARQGDNPFHNFLSLYLVIQDTERGLLVKLPGKVELDPVTGQITTTFDDLPQFPVSDFQLNLKGGVRAALVNPSTCGTKTITAQFYSWADQNTPVTQSSSYDVTQKPDGSPCVQSLGDRPFKPQLTAGTENDTAGSFSPFAFRLIRSDEDQEFSQLNLTLPPGLVAKIAKISECPAAGIAQAILRTGAGEGALEQSVPSCPTSSQLGTTEVGTGVGVPLIYVPGKAYLAGPYQGAPLSIVVITPAVVGPYDLGVIAVRSAAFVDPQSGQVTVKTDPFPQIYQGIPVRLRDIRIKVDRPETILNPTSCDPMAVTAHVTGTGGDVNSTADDSGADLSTGFQAGSCANLGFAPRMSMKLLGGKGVTTRSKNPGLLVNLTPRAGDANIRSTVVTLTDAFQIDQRHLGNLCSESDLAANDCAGKHQVGTVTATTPLLDAPLSGPVYAVSGPGSVLPQLAFVLHGQFDALLRGDNKGVGNHLRTSFPSIPDVPVSSFQLHIDGGSGGYLVNTRNVCASHNTSLVQFVGQNGKTEQLHVPVKSPCSKAHKKSHRHHERRHHRGGAK